MLKKLILNKVKSLQPGSQIAVKVDMGDANKEDYIYEYVLSTAEHGILQLRIVTQ